MAIAWTVQVLTAGRENRQGIESGAASTEQAARAAAAAALLSGARRLGRCEFWVSIGSAVIMVVPGLDDIGVVDIVGLRNALEELPAARPA